MSYVEVYFSQGKEDMLIILLQVFFTMTIIELA